MPWFTLRRDGAVVLTFALLVLMLIAGLAGADRLFAFVLAALIGVLAAVGFVRRGRPLTWIPPLLAAAVLVVSFAGMFAHADTRVDSAADTVLGFQPATAYLVYGLWVPAFFTLGLAFALLFPQLTDDRATRTPRRETR